MLPDLHLWTSASPSIWSCEQLERMGNRVSDEGSGPVRLEMAESKGRASRLCWVSWQTAR